MTRPLLAALLLLSVPALASPESDRIAALEERLAALESASATQPQPTPRVSQRYTNAARALLGYRFAAFGSPIFAFPGYSGGGSTPSTPFSGGTVSGATTFSADVTFNGGTGALGFASGETLVPADATLNVTGAITASGALNASGSTFTALSGVATATVRVVGQGADGLMLASGLGGYLGATPAGGTARSGFLYNAGGIDFYTSAAAGATTSAVAAKLLANGGFAQTPVALALSGAHTALPVGGIVEVTCTGAQTWTPTETSATNGEIHHIVNVGADALTMDHVAGQVLLNGGADVVLGQNDAMTIYYSTAASAWVQLGATSNN